MIDSSVVGFSKYNKEDYPEILRMSEDADEMFDTWEEWKESSENGAKQMKDQGYKVVEVLITPTELLIFCKENGLAINGGARSQYTSNKTGALKWRK